MAQELESQVQVDGTQTSIAEEGRTLLGARLETLEERELASRLQALLKASVLLLIQKHNIEQSQT